MIHRVCDGPSNGMVITAAEVSRVGPRARRLAQLSDSATYLKVEASSKMPHKQGLEPVPGKKPRLHCPGLGSWNSSETVVYRLSKRNNHHAAVDQPREGSKHHLALNLTPHSFCFERIQKGVW